LQAADAGRRSGILQPDAGRRRKSRPARLKLQKKPTKKARINRMREFQTEIRTVDSLRQCHCLAKADPEIFPEHERAPMRRAIAFCRTIKASEQVERLFGDIADKYRSLDPDGGPERELPAHAAPSRPAYRRGWPARR